jgi:putative transposase
VTYSERHLPHWIPDRVPVFVTWRLAGTLPRPAPAVLYADDSPGRRFLAHDRALDRATSGPDWLKDPRVARMIVEALEYGESKRQSYELRAYVVMPNHVHVIWEPKSPMPGILKWLKGTTAHRAKTILKLDAKFFWQEESYDHWIRSDVELQRIIRYVESNPVSAGLARSIEDWPWSSARQTARPSVPPSK